MRQAAGIGLLLVSAVMLLYGAIMAGGYLVRAVQVIHQPDRSWLFWGFAIFFIGVALLGSGWQLLRFALGLLRRPG